MVSLEEAKQLMPHLEVASISLADIGEDSMLRFSVNETGAVAYGGRDLGIGNIIENQKKVTKSSKNQVKGSFHSYSLIS